MDFACLTLLTQYDFFMPFAIGALRRAWSPVGAPKRIAWGQEFLSHFGRLYPGAEDQGTLIDFI